MAPIIIRRIETAQRQPLLDELLSLGDDARAVLSAKLNDNEDELTEAAERVEAATAALVKAAANTTVDAPALAGERRTLAEAQAAEKQVQARHDLLAELRRLLTPKPPPQPPAPPEEQQPPADTARGRARYPTDFSAGGFVLVRRFAGPVSFRRRL